MVPFCSSGSYSDPALGLYTCIVPFYSNKFIGTYIYLRSQVSVYRTIGPLVISLMNLIHCFYIMFPLKFAIFFTHKVG